MNLIFFDGTIETSGVLLVACESINEQVYVVKDRNLSREHQDWLNGLQDCGGSIGSFKNGRFVPHARVGSGRRLCQQNRDGIELFFRHLAERDDMNDDDKIELLRMLRVCDRDGCGECDQCNRIAKVAEDYGFYDFEEWAPTFSAA